MAMMRSTIRTSAIMPEGTAPAHRPLPSRTARAESDGAQPHGETGAMPFLLTTGSHGGEFDALGIRRAAGVPRTAGGASSAAQPAASAQSDLAFASAALAPSAQHVSRAGAVVAFRRDGLAGGRQTDRSPNARSPSDSSPSDRDQAAGNPAGEDQAGADQAGRHAVLTVQPAPALPDLGLVQPLLLQPSPVRPGLLHPGAVLAADPRKRFRRVAIIHYWLVTMRGGERVLERLLELFPQADIFTHVYDPDAMSDAIRAHRVQTSFIQNLPGARRHYQSYLPLMPMALEQLDLRGYDLVISSESGPAKGVIPAPDALHVCYVHSPMRYLWDHYHDYRAEAGWLKRAVMPLLCHGLRQWDTSSAARVDRVLANSHFIRERVAKAWRREAAVVHPPVDPALFAPVHGDEIEPGYLWVGQLVPYKRADIAIDAFNALGLPLTVVGDGPQAAMLKKRAGPNIRMIPRLDFAALRRAYARCRALVFTAEEDFGIVPVEVMASGRPVVAYGRGGALDSVVEGRTGLFFADQTAAALVDAVERLERWLPYFDPAAAMARARDFTPERFDAGVLEALA